MPELLPPPPDPVTTQAPTPGVSPEQIAQPYRELADTLDKAGTASENLAETSAKYGGLQAGANATVNPDGSVQVPKAPIIGPASQVYEASVKMGVLAKGEGEVKDAARKLMLDHTDDPEGFRIAANQLRDTTIKQYADAGAPDVGIALGSAVDSANVFTYRMLVNQKHSIDLREAGSNIKDGMTSAMNDLHALASAGDTSSPQFMQAWSKYTTLGQQAVSTPGLGYSPDKAKFDADQLHASLQGDVFVNHANQIYKDPTANGGQQKALTFAQSILTDPSVAPGLSIGQKRQLYTRAIGEIKAQDGIRRQDISELRQGWSSLKTSAAAGFPADPKLIDQIEKNAKSLGDYGLVADVAAQAVKVPLLTSFAQQPPAERASQLAALNAGVNPGSPGEAALIAHESGGNPRVVNKFGYAGLYQFGAPNLADLGLYKPGAGESVSDRSATGGWSGQKWSGTFNIPGFPQVKTLNDFLASPPAQQAAFGIHAASMDAAIKANGLDKYIGKNVGGVPITQDGLRMMIHLGGVGNTLKALHGEQTAADANGTTLLDYAKVGAFAGAGNPAFDAWYQQNQQVHANAQTWADWKGVMTEFGKGIMPNPKNVSDIIDAARAGRNSALLEQIQSDYGRIESAKNFGGASAPMRASVLGSLQAQAASGQMPPGNAALLGDLERVNKKINDGMKDNPIATTVATSNGRFQMPGPLNPQDPQAFAAGLAQRAKIAQSAAQSQGAPVPALDAADLAQIKGSLDTADPAHKAAIFQGLATLPPDVRGATLKKLGGNDPATMAQVAAGSLMGTAPDVAQSIFRGQAAMKADPKWGPEAAEGGKAAFSTDLDKNLPATAFPLQARTDPTGPYTTMTAMVKARYADLSAQAADTKYSPDRVAQAAQDVTGGVLSHNGSPLIAPARGMTQGQFDAVLAGVTDKDLAGVTTKNGNPITADYLRSSGKLESAADGTYNIKFGDKPGTYAMIAANSEMPSLFKLDLRGRAPSPSYRPPLPEQYRDDEMR